MTQHPTYLRMLKGLKDDGEKDWSVYIVRCADRSLYTGIAKEVTARIQKHNSGRGGAYTRSHRPVSLLYQENGFSRAGALRRECAIKALPLARKEKLILESAVKNLPKITESQDQRAQAQAMMIAQEALNMVKDSHEMKNDVNALKGRLSWRAMQIAAWKMDLEKLLKVSDSGKLRSQILGWFDELERSRFIEEQALQKLSHRLKNWAEYGRMISDNSRGPRPVEAINLARAAQTSVERWRPHADRKRLALSLQAKEELLVRGDRGLVEQVIENLIDNAIKATQKGTVDVVCQPDSAGALLEVRDTGCGIPAEELNRLFEKPYYEDHARRPTEPGTGVGLYLVSQYVRSLGGQVWAKSRVGKGSSFFVQLPRYNQGRRGVPATP